MGGNESSNQMRVQVVDQDGRVQCDRGGDRLFGALATNAIQPGVTLRLAVGEPGAESSLEIVGRPKVTKTCAVRAGLVFEMDIKRITRAVTSAPDPFAPSETYAALPHPPLDDKRGNAPVSAPAEGEFDRAFGQMESEPSGVYGSLAGMSLPEVLQSLEHGRRDATVLVRPKGGVCGVLRVEQGRVIYVSQGTLAGEDAFYPLASTTRGSFLIRFDAERSESMTPNIDQHLHWLLLESARRSDEAASKKSAVAHGDPQKVASASDTAKDNAEPSVEAAAASTPPLPVPASDLQSALESAISKRETMIREDPRDPQAFADAAMAEAFEATETRPALFSQFFTEAEPHVTCAGGPVSSMGSMSALELDDEIERARAAEEDRGPSGWTDTHSTPSFS